MVQGVSADQCESLLYMKGITKAFPGVQALDHVELEVRAGEVHALVGENGAGKSTLCKILTGALPMDSGEILLQGQRVDIRSPLEAQRLGIRVIHQEFTLVNDLSVAENIFLDDLGRDMWGWLTPSRLYAEAAAVLADLGIQISPRALVRELTVAEQQVVEIARAIRKEAKVLIMDEPTSALNDQEVERLFRIINQLREHGTSVIYISHKLEEIMTIADRVTILRDGRHIGVFPTQELTRDAIVRMMVGRPLGSLFARRHRPTDVLTLEVEGLSAADRVRNISLRAYQGEVVGIAGLMGAGQSQLLRALFGAESVTAGIIRLRGRPVVLHSPLDAIRHGIALLTENRKEEGLVLSLAVQANISLASLDRISRYGFLQAQAEYAQACRYVKELNIRTPDVRREVGVLSGGNQQKVVLGKWLATAAEVILMSEPTRGIDVGAKAEVYRIIDDLAAAGKTILLASSEMKELINLCDRIYVMHEGRIVAELDARTTTQEEIGTYATGGVYDASVRDA